LRKLVLVAVAATASVALASSAIAQTDDGVVLDVTAKPSNSGTKKKPGNVSLDFNAKVNLPGTTVEVIDVLLPKGLKFSGKGFKKCNVDDLLAVGVTACPSGSKVGSPGTANALAGPAGAPVNFDVYPFVQNTSTFAFYLSQQAGPLQSVVFGKITNGGRKLSITIPEELRRPGGLDATLVGLDQTFKGKAGKKKYIVSSTSCPKGGWKIGTKLTFATRLDGAPVPPPESREFTLNGKK
jgi:hypothetical protein